MASETTKLQFNFKTPAGSLLNVYADDSDDANLQLQALTANLPVVNEIEALLGAVSVVQNAFQPPAQGGQSAPAQAQQAPAQQAQGPAPVCQHGPMEFKSGVAKASGKPYKMWACTSQDRNNQCAPQWIR